MPSFTVLILLSLSLQPLTGIISECGSPAKKVRDSSGETVRDRWVLINESWVVNRKLTKLAVAITGTIDVFDSTLRMTVVLIGVLVIATFTAAIMQIMPMVG